METTKQTFATLERLTQTKTVNEADGATPFPLTRVGDLRNEHRALLEERADSGAWRLNGGILATPHAVHAAEEAILVVDGIVEYLEFPDGEVQRRVGNLEGVYDASELEEIEDVTPKVRPVRNLD